jgi:HEPN domain-containing protein
VIKLHALLMEETKVSFSIEEDQLDLVDAVYIDTRYPGSLGLLPSGFPTTEDAKELLAIAEKVYQEISQKLGR